MVEAWPPCRMDCFQEIMAPGILCLPQAILWLSTNWFGCSPTCYVVDIITNKRGRESRSLQGKAVPGFWLRGWLALAFWPWPSGPNSQDWGLMSCFAGDLGLLVQQRVRGSPSSKGSGGGGCFCRAESSGGQGCWVLSGEVSSQHRAKAWWVPHSAQ